MCFLDPPHMFTRSKLYKIPLRTTLVRLNCSVVSNPLSVIEWIYAPNETFLTPPSSSTGAAHEHEHEHDYRHWTSISDLVRSEKTNHHHHHNSHPHHHHNHSDQSTFDVSLIKLPTSNYRVVEEIVGTNQLNSSLIINVI